MVQAPTTQEPSQQSEQQEILPPEEEQKLRDKWEEHFDLFYKENITQRKYQTRVDRHIDSKLLATVDKIVNEKLKVMYESEEVSLWDLNVIYYTSAVTILEAKGKLREIKNMTKQHNKPGWRIQLEQRFDSLRRKLSFINIILKCKEEQKVHCPSKENWIQTKKMVRKNNQRKFNRSWRTILASNYENNANTKESGHAPTRKLPTNSVTKQHVQSIHIDIEPFSTRPLWNKQYHHTRTSCRKEGLLGVCSVSHPWLIKSLQLAKVPPILINAIEKLTSTLTTNAYIKTDKENVESGRIIDCKRGILQGDALSVILFILQVNPASFLLEDVEGYQLGNEEIKQNLISESILCGRFKVVCNRYWHRKTASRYHYDIHQRCGNELWGKEMCMYLHWKWQEKKRGQTIEINGLRVKELQEEELYTYLGQDEAVGYNGPLNKEKVTREYKRRVRNIWTSELYSGNKITAHNTFAVPLITPTIGILNWTRKEIEDLDKATRRIMCYTGNLHMRSDIIRIYVPRKQGGRGLASIEDIFTSRILAHWGSCSQ